MKKIFSFLLIILLILTYPLFNNNKQSSNFDTVTAIKNFELTVSSDIVISKELNTDLSCSKEFLTTDLSKGDEYKTAKEGYILIAISYSVKSTAEKRNFFEESASLLYNNKYTYEADNQYCSSGQNDIWYEFTSIEIEPLAKTNCKAYFSVPEEVINNTEAPLKFSIANSEYTIR